MHPVSQGETTGHMPPGRGRGRHLPINYPDGLTCKLAPTDPYPHMDPEKLPVPPVMTTTDRELLALRRSLLGMPATLSFRVRNAPASVGLRYSDGLLDPVPTPFDQTKEFTMTRNTHFPQELQPVKSKSGGRKRGAAAALPAAVERKRLHKTGAVGQRLDEMAKHEDGTGPSGAGAAGTAAEEEEDEEEEEQVEAKNEKKDDDDEEGDGNESDEDEDLYEAEDWHFNQDDGMDDDFDDGGDDGGGDTY